MSGAGVAYTLLSQLIKNETDQYIIAGEPQRNKG